MESRHVDVLEMDAASNTGIDDVREIIESVRYRPVSARYKVYIIDEVHMLSKAAFNGLLKTLEEPPPHVKFIFATTEVRKVPVTVLSRCQRFDLRRVDSAVLIEHFSGIAEKEGVSVEAEALAQISRGPLKDRCATACPSWIRRLPTAAAPLQAMKFVRCWASSIGQGSLICSSRSCAADIAAALDGLKEQYTAGADPAVVLSDMAELVHWVTRLRLVPDAAKDPTMSEAEAKRGKETQRKPQCQGAFARMADAVEGDRRSAGRARIRLLLPTWCSFALPMLQTCRRLTRPSRRPGRKGQRELMPAPTTQASETGRGVSRGVGATGCPASDCRDSGTGRPSRP